MIFGEFSRVIFTREVLPKSTLVPFVHTVVHFWTAGRLLQVGCGHPEVQDEARDREEVVEDPRGLQGQGPGPRFPRVHGPLPRVGVPSPLRGPPSGGRDPAPAGPGDPPTEGPQDPGVRGTPGPPGAGHQEGPDHPQETQCGAQVRGARGPPGLGAPLEPRGPETPEHTHYFHWVPMGGLRSKLGQVCGHLVPNVHTLVHFWTGVSRE